MSAAAPLGASGSEQPRALPRLTEILRAQGGLMARLLVERPPAEDRASPARGIRGGPRAGRAVLEYEVLLEAIYEGYLLHYGHPRLLDSPEADLGLLAGDRLYALGLARLVELGDTVAVAELADTISLSALAHAAGRPELAAAVWEAGVHAVGWGSSEAHSRAKRLALNGSAEAIEAMRTSA